MATSPDQKDGNAEEAPRVGRPRNGEPGSSVSTWIPESDHDRLIVLATRRRQSVSRLVCEILKQKLR